MITCANCESPQFLQITSSRIYFENGDTIVEVEEDYECTFCGAEGEYREDGDKISVRGDVGYSDETPRAC